MASSRLDRLFVLLDTGSSAVTREAAAQQLGEIVKLHPHELHPLLNKLHTYIISHSWDTRIAAGKAVEAIVRNVPKWDPQPSVIVKNDPEDTSRNRLKNGRLSLAMFNICHVLERGSYLLAGDEKLFEADDENSGIDPKERTARQRRLVNQRLGLDVAEVLGVDTQTIFTNEDLESVKVQHMNGKTKSAVMDVVSEEMTSAGASLSSREQNRARRKAKLLAKQKSVDVSDSFEDAPEKKKPRMSLGGQGGEGNSSDEEGKMVIDAVLPGDVLYLEDQEEWPLEEFCDALCTDLFSPSWETRHGAGTALREIVKTHACGAGKYMGATLEQMESCHQAWLEDIAVRMVCVLALDRFGDFVSDQVVAPVKETCAQTLGGVLQLLMEKGVMEVLKLLLDLLSWHQWEARHGGLLGLKYLLAVREDMESKLLPIAFSHIYRGICDPMDDVVAVAASALIPVATYLVKQLSVEVRQVVTTLWDSLLEIDDLTASTHSVLMLLAKLLSHPGTWDSTMGNLAENVSRLWPFLYHSSRSVRSSALHTLETLTGPNSPQKPEQWLAPIIQPTVQHVYQRAILETCSENLKMIYKIWDQVLCAVALEKLLPAVCPLVPSWLCLMMGTAKTPLDPALMLQAQHNEKMSDTRKRRLVPNLEETVERGEVKFYLGENDTQSDAKDKYCAVMKARCSAAKLLGKLSIYVIKPMPGVEYSPEDTPVQCYERLLLAHLTSRSALQRMAVGLVVREWAMSVPNFECPNLLKAELHNCLHDVVYYDEIAVSFTRLQQETRDFMSMLCHYKLEVGSSFTSAPILTLEQIHNLSGPISLSLFANAKLKPKVQETLEERRKAIQNSVSQTSSDQMSLSTTTQAVLSGAAIRAKVLPQKLNPVIKPLMECIKKEENEQLQMLAAEDLAVLLEQCLQRDPNPSGKVIKNLATFLCVDREFTPKIEEGKNNCGCDKVNGILTLTVQQNSAEKQVLKRSNTITGRGPGRPPGKVGKLQNKPITSNKQECDSAGIVSEEETQRMNSIQRRGCSCALIAMARHFRGRVPDQLPSLWKLMIDPFESPYSQGQELVEEMGVESIHWLQLLEVMIPYLAPELINKMNSKLIPLATWLDHPYTAVRHMTARVFGTLATVLTDTVMAHTIDRVVPLVEAATSDRKRQGAVECVNAVIESLGFDIVPYIVLLIVPLLGRMSDQNSPVRLMATQCFAMLIRLMPLEGGVPDPPGLSTRLMEKRQKERKFLEHLMDPTKLENFKIPVTISAQLRSYQQSGVNWLAFLNQYKLHGILCDDMGLGKTLQSICMLASDHYLRQEKYKKTRKKEDVPQPSLVVCPPTLTGHWIYEVGKFVSHELLNPLHYVGVLVERNKLRQYFPDHNLIVASYDIVRNEIDFFSTIKWNYVVLDEGHIIKNGKTKLSRAIKQLIGNHRLILSGTPIQNNVLELWSLFDFLMPGFLGSEKQFIAKYAKPILQSRDAKSSSKEQEAGVLAMEALHRQVLPFLLRRMKEDVLKDLPPKITQDYYCELSPLQERLYEDFARSQAKQNIDNSLCHLRESEDSKALSHGHIFQALQYLRKVCNHPKLVLNGQHPQYKEISDYLKNTDSSMSDIQHAAKLPALKQLLLDCGIGGSSSTESVVSQHRALVFCQLKAMLDIIENDLFKAQLPEVTYLRLDGSVPAGNRHALVQRFNSDPSIDLLLLTTQVGGLGLNLTGADTVIFVEHDWNPMRDLQAMDRVHRIGQKRVVNVYRLITKGTLEEKIMGLQKFKLMTAKTVISQENSSLQSMGTDQLLDLFSLDERRNGKGRESGEGSNRFHSVGVQNVGMKSLIENLPELWDEGQYDAEYNMENFMETLKK
ncbi:histone acetyltransferase 1 isoform X2 [Oratosquilla oratoria]|uniref:histone acetyltransferase 1 isoform X2 n=1 Tax=Oratosquilla oratoria TaxID=337810 RepID=UPI003F77729D